VFGQAGNGLATMNFFPPFLFSLLGLGIHAKPLKIQWCPLFYNFFVFGSFSFDFNFFLISSLYI
jgi:hypothetical protein